MDLLKKMLKKNPLERISAKEALKHELFADEMKNNQIDIDLGQIKEINDQIKKNYDPENNSFVVRDQVINGKLDTVKDTDSKGGIISMKKMKKNVNRKAPRTSIYKTVLSKNK